MSVPNSKGKSTKSTKLITKEEGLKKERKQGRRRHISNESPSQPLAALHAFPRCAFDLRVSHARTYPARCCVGFCVICHMGSYVRARVPLVRVWTRTRTSTNPNGTAANAAGRSGNARKQSKCGLIQEGEGHWLNSSENCKKRDICGCCALRRAIKRKEREQRSSWHAEHEVHSAEVKVCLSGRKVPIALPLNGRVGQRRRS